jgi:hypothetical protein
MNLEINQLNEWMIVTGSLKTIVQVQVVSLENLLPPVQVNAHAPSLARPFGEDYLATKWHVFPTGLKG